jgi:hypothetical protein
MTFGQILGLIAIILGVIAGITEDKIVFDALTWFVLAISLVLVLGIGVVPVPGVRQQG